MTKRPTYKHFEGVITRSDAVLLLFSLLLFIGAMYLAVAVFAFQLKHPCVNNPTVLVNFLTEAVTFDSVEGLCK
jgi:hypothetical protein